MRRLRVLIQPRPDDYHRKRYWWMHELRNARARVKYRSGPKKDIKAIQRELAKLRKEYRL